jgi:hypothetical protein
MNRLSNTSAANSLRSASCGGGGSLAAPSTRS